MLRALMQQYEGYQRSVQNLLRSADQDPSIKKHLIGPLADLIRVEPGYETAVEVALGGALQNVVVESEQDAKVLIQLLKERHLGRVTFCRSIVSAVRSLCFLMLPKHSVMA